MYYKKLSQNLYLQVIVDWKDKNIPVFLVAVCANI